MSETVSVHGPEELLAVLPYQLGYHPRRSVVAVALDGRRVHFVARVDIPPDRYVPQTVAALVGPLRREVRGRVHLVGYEDVEGECDPLLLAVLEAVESGAPRSPTCSSCATGGATHPPAPVRAARPGACGCRPPRRCRPSPPSWPSGGRHSPTEKPSTASSTPTPCAPPSWGRCSPGRVRTRPGTVAATASGPGPPSSHPAPSPASRPYLPRSSPPRSGRCATSPSATR
ncbi:DUF4192 family protein [Phycicoccus sp. HDW14]|nr:DUF4192 family protein [Phycicoccus sp. HDW14]